MDINKNNFNINSSLEETGSSVIGLGEGQALISSPVTKKGAKEAYFNDGTYDEDQLLSIEVLKGQGTDVSPYVNPNNSPEQMFELANSIALGVPEEILKILANPAISFMAIQVINQAYKEGFDLSRFLPWADPQVLKEGLLAARSGLDLDKLIIQGLNSRQIEQRRKAMEQGVDPDSIKGNYNRMRMARFPNSDISNTKTHTQKGQGVSTHSRGGSKRIMDKSAGEAIPNEYKEYAKRQATGWKKARDPEGNIIKGPYGSDEYEYDENGQRIEEVNHQALVRTLKNWANRWAEHGISIDSLGDFDQYKIDPGIKLDRAPKGALTILEISTVGFIFIDKRSTEKERYDYNQNWGYIVSMERKRDHRWVPLERIPESQLLEEARTTWVIPEEAITLDTRKLRVERKNQKSGSIERARTPEEIKELKRFGGPKSCSPFKEDYEVDKSGYLIDRDEIRRKLAKYKEGKALKEAGSITELAKRTLDNLVKKFNEKATWVLDQTRSMLDDSQFNQKSGKTTTLNRSLEFLFGAKREILLVASELEKEVERVTKAPISENGNPDLEYGLNSLVKDCNYALTGTGSRAHFYDLSEVRRFFDSVREAESATESLKGHLRATQLSATEGYFIDRRIIEGLDD